MYNINNKQAAIYEVQRFLFVISKFKRQIPSVYPDGIYGAETKEAVLKFQKEHGLPKTGSVDLETWTALVSEYRKTKLLTDEPNGITPFRTVLYNKQINSGENSDMVLIAQIMLNRISTKYISFENVAINGTFDKNTEAAIKSFQKIQSIPVTGNIDKTTWNRLSDAYNSYNLFFV